MASSWAEYDSSYGRGSSAHLSSTSGTKKRRSGSGASSSSAPASSSGGTTKRKSAKSAPTGIDALYVDPPPGIDTRLQFQWIRPHPSSAILAAAATDSRKSASKSGTGVGGGGANISPHIVEAARLVEHYRQAKTDSNGDSKSRSDESPKRKLPLPKVDLGCINAEVELTSLFDPPLLSEWGVPGASMDISYGDMNDDQESFSDSDSDESHALHSGGDPTKNSDGDGKSRQSTAAEIESALGKLVQYAAAAKGTKRLDDSTKDTFSDLSADTANDNLLELLPSRMLLQKVRDVASDAADDITYLSIGVKSLTVLADITQTESMGRHILSVLAPVLLSTSSDATMEMKDNIVASLKLLAKALVHECGLGKLSKGNLFQLAEGGEIGTSTMTEPSELMDQFLIAIGKAYHE